MLLSEATRSPVDTCTVLPSAPPSGLAAGNVEGATGAGTGASATGDDVCDGRDAQPEASTRRTAIEGERRITGSGTEIGGPTRANCRV